MQKSKIPSKYSMLTINEFIRVFGPVEQEEIDSNFRRLEEPLEYLVNKQVYRRDQANAILQMAAEEYAAKVR